jgi:hemerythrin-like domain-containing protein
MNATRQLIAEHDVILKVLDCLERMARGASGSSGLDAQAAAQALDFLKTFADRCHHGKEEGVLFPLMEQHGMPRHVGPIAVMLGEHEQGRARIRGMANALADGKGPEFAHDALAYVELLRDHIAKENEVLFPMADGLLGEAGAAEAWRRFEAVEHEDMGAGTHERYLALSEELCRRFGVEAATAPTHGGGCCGHEPGHGCH